MEKAVLNKCPWAALRDARQDKHQAMIAAVTAKRHLRQVAPSTRCNCTSASARPAPPVAASIRRSTGGLAAVDQDDNKPSRSRGRSRVNGSGLYPSINVESKRCIAKIHRPAEIVGPGL